MAVGNLEFIKSASGTSVSTLDVTDCFSADYDVYFVSISKGDFSAQTYNLLRFLDSGGTVISASEYDYATLDMYANASFAELRGTSQTSIPNFGLSNSGTADFGGISFYIYNPYDSSSYTFVAGQSSAQHSGGGRGSKFIGVHKSAEQLSGIQMGRVSGTIDNLTVNVFGVK